MGTNIGTLAAGVCLQEDVERHFKSLEQQSFAEVLATARAHFDFPRRCARQSKINREEDKHKDMAIKTLGCLLGSMYGVWGLWSKVPKSSKGVLASAGLARDVQVEMSGNKIWRQVRAAYIQGGGTVLPPLQCCCLALLLMLVPTPVPAGFLHAAVEEKLTELGAAAFRDAATDGVHGHVVAMVGHGSVHEHQGEQCSRE